MSIILNGTTGITTPDLTSTDDITANSATVLTSASNIPAANITGSLPAIDGSALTGVGGVASLNGETGAITNTSLDAIGSYLWGRPANLTAYAPGSTASNVRSVSIGYIYTGFYQSSGWEQVLSTRLAPGTWRCITGSVNDNGRYTVALWVRIS
jgi:hypothetical protein